MDAGKTQMLTKLPQYIRASVYVKRLLLISLFTPAICLLVQAALYSWFSVTLPGYFRAAIVTLILSAFTWIVYRKVQKIECYLWELKAAREKFFYMASHDLKAPLAAISMSIELFQSKDPEAAERAIDIIRRQTRNMAGLIDDLLLSSSAQAGKLVIKIDNCKVREIVFELEEVLSPLLKDKGLSLSIEVDHLRCPCDPDRLKQILINLLSNAIKHSRPGGVISLKTEEKPDEICFTIEDAGTGIPRDKLKNIFEPFEQAGTCQEGHGLGLAIVKTLVEAHGGRVWAESWQGRGSKFHFTIKKSVLNNSLIPVPSSAEEHPLH